MILVCLPYIVAFTYKLPVNLTDIHKRIVIFMLYCFDDWKIVNNYYKTQHIEYCEQGLVFKQVRCITMFHFKNYIWRLTLLLLFTLFKSGNWGTESLRKVTKLTCGKVEKRAQVIWVQKLFSSPFYFSITILI